MLNEQRTFIYDQRNAILGDENLIDRIHTTIKEFIEESFEEHKGLSKSQKEENAKNLQGLFKAKFGYTLTEADFDAAEKNLAEETAHLIEHFQSNLKEKQEAAGKENLNIFIRFQYLQAIDKRWLDHLENLEALREAVYLRSYGQKNPLTEYKLEGFDIFYSMLDEIRLEIASRLVLVQISVEDESAVSRQARTVQGTAQHNSLEAFNGGTALSGKSRPENAQVVRITPKVGRNDPCPCGSGKKYKHCCGRNA